MPVGGSPHRSNRHRDLPECNGQPLLLLHQHKDHENGSINEGNNGDIENGHQNHLHVVTKRPLSRHSKLEAYLTALTILLFCACIVFIFIAFSKDGNWRQQDLGQASAASSFDDVCITENCVKTAAALLESMDSSVDPCEDFFQYACGSWNKKNIIPEDKTGFNTFEKLHDELLVKLKALLEEPLKSGDAASIDQAKILYRSCMNLTEIDRLGKSPLQEVLKPFGGWPIADEAWSEGKFNLEATLGKLRRQFNLPVMIDSWIAADDKNSSIHILQIDQPVLGMPSREYYTESLYLEPYRKFMIEIAKLLGADGEDVIQSIEKVLSLEIMLANITIPQSQKHDTSANYNKFSIKELMRQVPGIKWMNYFENYLQLPFTQDEPVVVLALTYFRDLEKIVLKTDHRVLANYMLWRLVKLFVPELSKDFREQRNSYRKVIQGVVKEKVRWQKCVEYANERMGMAVGALFVREHFKKESKDTATEMINNIKAAFQDLLRETDWMDDVTKEYAIAKASAMNERIGYPEYILNNTELDNIYTGLDFKKDQYFKNLVKVEEFLATRIVNKLGKPVPLGIWEQDPAVVNAFYNPNKNDIVFPAGILQPRFYSSTFPKSLNYGGIGVVIGHEITHGFDDKGRQFDKNGNLKHWMDNQTINEFRKKADCMTEQYSQYKLEQINMNIDGKNTEGENIADNGGLKEAFRAYRSWVAKNGEEQRLPGLNLDHNQLFFLNYAQIWCGTMRDEEALHKIRTSVHSPGPIRVRVPLSNSLYFAEAYNCPVGSVMNPVHKCEVW
ncbi:neprilysin-1 isoform X2 [Lingula anatina]|uniref:Neprilysin-1 isoform X2 n=1 Tax=Lingula anatina TaxID=7574 RepID=A0A1S3H0N8_LINAN|nr:neprilysin-1 isoform X2 [Lingula anatina]|eukprot:XP_013379563.1 neprilysin-1 isoform X2 [Lingula anatina]